MSTRVDIVQEYVPNYRVPLFRAMKKIASSKGMDIRILAGEPQGTQAYRGDESRDVVDCFIRQKEIRALGKRINFRRTRRYTKQAALVIFEQARRNTDVYRALLTDRRRTALWGHGYDHVNTSGRLSSRLLAFLTNRAVWFFGYTPASVEYVAMDGFPEERTTTLWNTTDTKELRDSLEGLNELELNEFRVAHDLRGQTALSMGGLDSSKRLNFLIAASDKVAADLPDFRLLIAGDGEQKAYVIQQAKSRPWMKLLGPIHGHERALALRSSSMLAIPGRVGLVAVDSLVANVPIVTTDWAFHAPERAYLNSSNSLTCIDSIDDYSNGMRKLFQDQELSLRLRHGCQEDQKHFSIEHMAARFVDGIAAALTVRS